MNVRELIELLKTFNPELPVAYKCYSEQCLIKHDDIDVKSLCEPRSDGWLQNARPDKPSTEYLVFPGN